MYNEKKLADQKVDTAVQGRQVGSVLEHGEVSLVTERKMERKVCYRLRRS